MTPEFVNENHHLDGEPVCTCGHDKSCHGLLGITEDEMTRFKLAPRAKNPCWHCDSPFSGGPDHPCRDYREAA